MTKGTGKGKGKGSSSSSSHDETKDPCAQCDDTLLSTTYANPHDGVQETCMCGNCILRHVAISPTHPCDVQDEPPAAEMIGEPPEAEIINDDDDERTKWQLSSAMRLSMSIVHRMMRACAFGRIAERKHNAYEHACVMAMGVMYTELCIPGLSSTASTRHRPFRRQKLALDSRRVHRHHQHQHQDRDDVTCCVAVIQPCCDFICSELWSSYVRIHAMPCK